MKYLIRFCLTLPLIIAAGVAFWLLNADPQQTGATADNPMATEQLTVAPEPPRSGPMPAPSDLVGKVSSNAVPEPLPPSLSGTSVPGGWASTDRLGNLIPTPYLRQMFEYFLSALGEESLEQLVARIKATLSVLEEPARSQAVVTLGAYLDYKLAVSELEQSYGDAAPVGPEEMQRRMAEIHALRRSWLDAETAEAFFAADEAIDRLQLEKRQIAANDSLTAEEQAEALRQAESTLPEPLRKAREETRQFAEYEQMRQQLADDPRALQAWRRETFGADAAGRLAQLEKDQQAWDQRWQAYARERDRLLSSGLAPPEREAALGRLRARHFNETERIRAEALDSIR